MGYALNHADEYQSTGAPRNASSLQDELRRVFAKAKLPSNPAIAAQILELVNDPNSTAEQFAQTIQTDVALAARLLGMANSARFAQRTPATTIQRAVTILGLRRIRTVALGFQLVSHLDRLGECPFDLKKFWQESVLRACLGQQIATRIASDHVEEAFLIGLLQDCGILTLVQLYGADYGKLYAQVDLSPSAFYQAERERFPHSHVDAIGVMAAEWKLPRVIAEPLSRHHTPLELEPAAPADRRLCALSYFLGSLRLRGEKANSRSEPALQDYLRENLGLDEQGLADCFAKAAESYRQIAPSLCEQLPDELDVADILEEAHRLLSDVAGETELHLEAAEAEREQALRQQDHLRHALGKYREKATRDPLTGLLNRAALIDGATNYIEEGASNRISLAVFFLDLDNFKRLNDEYGHERGDEVLRRVADAISGTLPNDALTGRYGGEEFVVVLPACSHDEALQSAKQVANAIRGIDYVRLRLPTPITCSLGAVWIRPTAEALPQKLIAAADELMYQAKRSGKDRCCFKSLEPDDTNNVLTIGPEADGSVAGHIGAGPFGDGAAAFDEDLVLQIAQELNDAPSDRLASARKQERRDLLVPCMINSFVAGENRLRHDRGYLRNISTGGIGVLASQPLDRGEPVEVAISKSASDAPSLFVGGLVAFCGHVKPGVYDIGIQTVVQSKDPIFRSKVPPAEQGLDWVAEAMVDTDEPDDIKQSA